MLAKSASILFDHSPKRLLDFGVTVGSTWLYYMRRSGQYKTQKEFYKKLHHLPYEKLVHYQKEKFEHIFWRAKMNSAFYGRKYQNIHHPVLSTLPILEKEEIRQHAQEMIIGDKSRMIRIHTGGTTGKGLTLYAKKSSVQARIALLDLFWDMHGYKFRDKMAWFSGRHLINSKDISKSIFWRTNSYLHIRYYSTFHMSFNNLAFYVADLNTYKPHYFSGFPSAIYEIARYMSAQNILPEFQLDAIFTTSETVEPHQRDLVESLFHCKIYDQYGAAEGPPFIIQCPENNLHIDMAGGIIEVIDENGAPSSEGEMLVTSFTMEDMPIIRYRIGDRIRLTGQVGCACGWDTPIVAEILGRQSDFLDIPNRGRMWCSQLGDCVKGTKGIVNFQVELTDNRHLIVYMVIDREQFEPTDRTIFLKKLRERVGEMPINIEYVDHMHRTAGGKFTIVRKAELAVP